MSDLETVWYESEPYQGVSMADEQPARLWWESEPSDEVSKITQLGDFVLVMNTVG